MSIAFLSLASLALYHVLIVVDLAHMQVPQDYLVIDPFCGTGSTGEAAMRCGRAFLGADIDGDVTNAAVARLAKVATCLEEGLYPDESRHSNIAELYIHGRTVHHSAKVRYLTRPASCVYVCVYWRCM